MPDPDRELPARPVQPGEGLLGPEPRVGAQQLRAAGAGPIDTGDQLVAEAQYAARGVRRSFAQPDVQHLTTVGTCGQQRVVAELAGVTVGGTLLLVSVDLADERIDIRDKPPIAGAGPGGPRPLQSQTEHAVQLPDVPDRKRTQARPHRRRRRDAVAQDRAGLARPEQVAVIDAIGAQDHRQAHRHHLASRVSRARAIAEIDALLNELLEPETSREQRRKHHAGIRDRPRVIKVHDRHSFTVRVTFRQGRDSRNLSLSSPARDVTPLQTPDRPVDRGLACWVSWPAGCASVMRCADEMLECGQDLLPATRLQTTVRIDPQPLAWDAQLSLGE